MQSNSPVKNADIPLSLRSTVFWYASPLASNTKMSKNTYMCLYTMITNAWTRHTSISFTYPVISICILFGSFWHSVESIGSPKKDTAVSFSTKLASIHPAAIFPIVMIKAGGRGAREFRLCFYLTCIYLKCCSLKFFLDSVCDKKKVNLPP